MPKTRRARRGISGISLLMAVILVLGGYIAYQRIAPLLLRGGCTAAGGGEDIPLGTGQAGIAATIAGVAEREALPVRAVTVAYATALQESKLQNLGYGDRDSVGVFQQRPSEGWGPRRDLENPVYATSKFFGALVKIPGYQQLPIYEAAQDVQHSADGFAYAQYAPMAAHMAVAFTGQHPHAVWCWYAQKISGTARTGAATTELAQTFGPQRTRPRADPALIVQVTGPRQGWVMAAWLVSHAQEYQIGYVTYAGYRWTAADGARGWARSDSPAPPGSIQLG